MSEGEATSPCPFCGEQIRATAVRCRHCGEYLDEEDDEPRRRRRGGDASAEEGVKWLVPIGRSGWAIAAGYFGLLSCFPMIGLLFGIMAIVTGLLALQHLGKNPKLGGKGRAIFGIVMGGICAVGNAILVVLA